MVEIVFLKNNLNSNLTIIEMHRQNDKNQNNKCYKPYWLTVWYTQKVYHDGTTTKYRPTAMQHFDEKFY